ncbi:MAG TPA: glycosyl hydrolase family 28-related protein [Victivallales bacterium]|nr:glycosyl hydrolase family 28-related protein [Victivallales bacterium]
MLKINVNDFGAVGNGKVLDTNAINKAIDACSRKGGGIVIFPPGRYLCGTIILKSHVSLFLEAGSQLVGTPDLSRYKNCCSKHGISKSQNSAWYNALVLGVGVENISILGDGTINGQKVFNPDGEEHMRGPHTILFLESKNLCIKNISIMDSGNYAIMIMKSDNIEIKNVKITGGWDGVHFRGRIEKTCRNISIIDCHFYTGDDSIAGCYAENLLIRNCILNSSCNGIRIIGPVFRGIIQNCLFFGPGRYEHRTSGRYNMLSGIILQPGAWMPCEGTLEDIFISDNTMQNVASPITIWQKVNENIVKNITVNRLTAYGVYRAAASVESWTNSPIENIDFNDIFIQYTYSERINHKVAEGVLAPHVDARPLPSWGFYAKNIRKMFFWNVRLKSLKRDKRPVEIFDNVVKLSKK